MSQLPSYLTEGLDDTAVIPRTAPAPAPPPKQRGWFRRNLLGLLTLVPLAAVLAGLGVYNGNGYERFWKREPRVPVVAGAGSWLSYSDARIRLAELVPAPEVTAPGGVKVWRATIDFDVPKQESLYGCKLLLEDDKGRLYGAGPDELDGVRGLPIPSCTDLDNEKLNRYQTVAFFVTPADARPVALRIEQALSLPRYARFTLGA